LFLISLEPRYTNFVSQHFAQKIKAKKCPSVAGINQTNTSIKSKVSLKIKSRINHFTSNLDFLVISKITENVPSAKINIKFWRIPKDVVLPDPQFDIPQQVDMLISAELFFDVLTNQQIKMQKGLPSLRETVFEWVVAKKRLTIYEQHAEKHFSDTIKRQPDGRYIVTLPTRQANVFPV
jgi:hypothetical protein